MKHADQTGRLNHTAALARFLLLAAALLAWFPAAPAGAADAVKLSVRPGLDGMVKLGTWFPVEVQIANSGADLNGEVQVQVEGVDNRGIFNRPPVVYSAPAVLPRQSNKRVVVEVYLQNPTDKIGAKLVSSGQTVAQAEVPLDRVSQNELMCGVLSGNRTALDFLPGVDLTARQQRHVRIAHMDVVDLPSSPQLLSSLDCLVLSNASLAGTTDLQRQALQGWTAAGGLLVVAGGPGWQKTFAGLPAGLLPVDVSGTVPLRSAKALSDYFGEPVEDPGPWLIADAKPTDGAVVVSQDNHPLIVAARRGQGAVVFLAMDPALEPLRSWRGSANLWKNLLGYAPSQAQLPSNLIRPYLGWGRPPRNAMSDLSQLKPATTGWLPTGLLLYALAIGPVSYLVLRRLNRLEWLLWVAPLLTVLASVGTFGLARTSSESDVLFNKISVVRTWDLAADGYARTYVAAFSPRDGSYTIEANGRGAPADALILPIFQPFPAPTGTPTSNQPVTVQRDSQTVISDYKLPARGLGTFSIDSRVPGGPELQSNLTLSDGKLAGTIVNTSSGKLTNASLIVGGDVVRLGDMAPGESRQVVAPVPDGLPIGYVDYSALVRQLYPNPAVATPVSSNEAMTRDILESALGSAFSLSTRVDLGPVSLVGWPDQSPIQLQPRNGRGTELDRTLLVAQLPVAAQPGEDLRVPSSLIERRNLVAGTGRVSGNTLSLSNGDTLLFEYVLPQRPDRFQINQIALDLGSTALGNSGPLDQIATLSVYDWPMADWKDVPIQNGIPTVLGDPSRVVSALGQVRTRFTYKPAPTSSNTVLTMDRFDLVVRGRGQ